MVNPLQDTFEKNLNEAFSSFTGADINAIITYNDSGTFKQKLIGTLSSITVSVVREVNPLWSMGSSDFRAVAKGKRSVSGTLVFTVFDKDPVVRDIFQDMTKTDLFKEASTQNNDFETTNGGLLNGSTTAQSLSVQAAQNVRNLVGAQTRRYADQLPPFDITISMTNENGASSVAAVRQIYIVSQGGGWSTHDLESDQVYSYIARFYEPLTPIVARASGNY